MAYEYATRECQVFAPAWLLRKLRKSFTEDILYCYLMALREATEDWTEFVPNRCRYDWSLCNSIPFMSDGIYPFYIIAQTVFILCYGIASLHTIIHRRTSQSRLYCRSCFTSSRLHSAYHRRMQRVKWGRVYA